MSICLLGCAFSVDIPTAGIFPQSVEVLIGDVTDKAAVQSAMQGVDVVVHMAALLHIVNPPPGNCAKNMNASMSAVQRR